MSDRPKIKLLKPLVDGSPALHKPCFLCEIFFIEGDICCFLPTFPRDEINLRLMRQGKSFKTDASLCHGQCIMDIMISMLDFAPIKLGDEIIANMDQTARNPESHT